MRIASVNTTTRRITTTQSLTQNGYSGFIPGHHFLLANVKEALKQAGQFYFDRPTGTLTYIPQAGEVLSSSTIIGPQLQQILRATQLSYVTFPGTHFRPQRLAGTIQWLRGGKLTFRYSGRDQPKQLHGSLSKVTQWRIPAPTASNFRAREHRVAPLPT